MTPSTNSFPFPAQVTTPDGEVLPLAKIGIAHDGDRLLFRVFTNAQPNGITMVHEVELADYEQVTRPLRPAAPSWIVTDAAGSTWTIVRGAGCGCGNPLKRFRPDRWVPSPS